MSNNQYADIAPDIPLSANGRQTYTYKLSGRSADNLHKHSRIKISFGHRTISGTIISIHDQTPRYTTKSIIASRQTKKLTKEQMKLALWLADVAHGGLGFTLRLFKPLPLTKHLSSHHHTTGLTAALIDHNTNRRYKYLVRLINHYIKTKQQVLFLVPEKWLIEIVGAKLKAQGLSTKSNIIIGTQKELFLPYNDLGLIIVAEEYIDTHKLWDRYPRLDNIYAANQLAVIHGSALLFSTPTPSWRLRHAIETGQITPLVRHEFVIKSSLLSFSFNDKIKHAHLPAHLIFKLKHWLSAQDHILLFYNRRHQEPILKELSDNNIANNKQLVLSTSAIFASQPASFDRIVWLFPEQSLNYPDHRSYSQSIATLYRLHQLSNHPRRHLQLVTRQPELVSRILFRSPQLVYQEEIAKLRKHHYPPTTDLVRLTVSGKSKPQAIKKAVSLKKSLEAKLTESAIRLRGPFHDFASAKKNKSSAHILLTGPLPRLVELYKDQSFDSADLNPSRIL